VPIPVSGRVTRPATLWHIRAVVLTFGAGMELDTTRFELRRHGVPVALEPQAFDVLAYLASHRDRLVGKDELLDAVWGGRFVTESALTSRIKQVRRAVGDDGRAQEVIRTVHGRGYRFVPPVTVVDAALVSSEAEGVPAPSPSSGATARTAYTVSDGLHIAYQVTGDGPRDIVLISGFVSHLELDWADPRHAHFLDRLGSMGRLIRFDKRGTGMSDRPPGVPDLETRMHDVLAVMDAVGSRRAVLCGYSEGGPMSVLMAATHPERVSGLALFGSYAKRTRADDNPWAQSIEENAAYTEKLLASWDWEADCRRRCPSADAAMQRWWAQRMRAAATPGTVRALMQMNARVDVRDALPAVRVPTLVLHRLGDPLFRVDEARYLAEHIPGARLELLDGGDHLVCGNPDQILDRIEAFLDALGDSQSRPSAARALAAVTAVDGDGAEPIAEQLASYGGRRCRDGSGRPLVLFDGPATAIRAGLDALAGGAGVRLGLSIEELPRDADVVDGPGVTIATRLAAATAPGTLAVSAAVGLLVGGSGVTLEQVHGGLDGEPLLRVAAP
jgi:pimeloyl-ACP methyl ester carboxylesterase